MQYHTIPCNTMQYHAMPCNTMQYLVIPCNTMQYLTIPCNTMQYPVIPCNTLHYHAIPSSIIQYLAKPCNTMQYNAIPCNDMQYHASLITADGAYHCPVGSIWPFLDTVSVVVGKKCNCVPILNTYLLFTSLTQLSGRASSTCSQDSSEGQSRRQTDQSNCALAKLQCHW